MSQQSNSAKSLKTQKKISIPVQRDQIHENLSGKTRQVQQTRQDRMNEKKPSNQQSELRTSEARPD